VTKISNLDSSFGETRNSITGDGTFLRTAGSEAPAEYGFAQDANASALNVGRPRVSVVIVTYGSSNELPDCLEGLLKPPVPLEVFLVDNASADNTPQMIADYAARFGNVHAILNSENIGLAAGNNIPRERCRGDYVLMLNPDTVFRDNSLERMVDFLDRNPDVGVVGPRNVYADGASHISAGRDWGIRHVLMWRFLPYRIPRLLHDRFASYKQGNVLFVSGSCLLIRRSIFEEIGGYDPEYFLCIEDVCDLCMRASQTGCRIVFLPDEKVVHLTGRSCVQAPYVAIWQGNRGPIYHFLKHKGIGQALVVSFLLFIAAAARVAVASVPGIVSKKYRSVARNYARVLWNIVVKNPIRTRNWSRPRSASHTTAA